MLDQAAEILGYRFENGSLLEEALTHASYAGHRLESNEWMEFLGDALLGAVVCEYLYHHFPELLEGEMTKIKSTVVSRKVCAEVSQRLGLDGMLSLGKGMSSRASLPSSVAAAVFESIIAAIYLDGGLDAAKDFVLGQLKIYIHEAAASAHQQNFKSVLQQVAQKWLPWNPAYLLLDEKGPDHAKAFEVCVELNDRRFGSAWANSKKDAEQQAALLALTALEIALIDDESGEITISLPEDDAQLQALLGGDGDA